MCKNLDNIFIPSSPNSLIAVVWLFFFSKKLFWKKRKRINQTKIKFFDCGIHREQFFGENSANTWRIQSTVHCQCSFSACEIFWNPKESRIKESHTQVDDFHILFPFQWTANWFYVFSIFIYALSLRFFRKEEKKNRKLRYNSVVSTSAFMSFVWVLMTF